MAEPHPTAPVSGSTDGHQAGATRKNRGIRFSDSEWEEVKQAAQTLGVTPAEFVRERILGLVRDDSGAATSAVPASLAPLIERNFRYAWILATVKRNEMIAEGRGEEMEDLVREARDLQNSLLQSTSE